MPDANFRPLLLAAALALALLPGALADGTGGDQIVNPYFDKPAWKLWRLDPTPVPGVKSFTGREKKEVDVTLTLQPLPLHERLYPVDPPRGQWMAFAKGAKQPPAKYAGMWDDVYASWSGLHGYVRDGWRSPDKTELKGLKGQIMHIVDRNKAANLNLLGVNFYHQSTTGMGHTIANAVRGQQTLAFEKAYFSSALITAPAHASYTETATKTTDLYLASFPAFFNSVGSSNSETMAITKLIMTGAHLSPELKLQLKRHGLYPSALLYLWKSALPVDAPYESELRHRIAYNAVGDRRKYPGGYGFAGSNRGDKSPAFHRYDDTAHMRALVEGAQALKSAPPEAILDVQGVEGATPVYALKKAALVLQEGSAAKLTVSAAGSYDIAGKSLTYRWRLLYGHPGTAIETTDGGKTAVIRVPWDADFPEGRTAVALFVHNGETGGNPAIVNIYRKRGPAPPNGGGYGGYKYDSPHANTRPVLLDCQDVVVRPGREATIALRAVDPEGAAVRWYTRDAGDAVLDGSRLTWKAPRRGATEHAVTVIASDGTSGNSYAGRTVRFRVAPAIHAQIEADRLVGPAPLKVKFSPRGSVAKGRARFGWLVGDKDLSKAKSLDGLQVATRFRHTFAKPGVYTVQLVVQAGKQLARTQVRVHVTDGKGKDGALAVYGGAARIAAGDETPAAFDGTDFGVVPADDKAGVVRRFRLVNVGAAPVERASVKLSGPGARAFTVVAQPPKTLAPGESDTVELRCKAAAGEHVATVEIDGRGADPIRFTVKATAR